MFRRRAHCLGCRYLDEKSTGALSSKKNVVCTALEKKMGIHGSATSVMTFEDSVGWLIGEPGLAAFGAVFALLTAAIQSAGCTTCSPS